jgi:hypothetical protein
MKGFMHFAKGVFSTARASQVHSFKSYPVIHQTWANMYATHYAGRLLIYYLNACLCLVFRQ